MVLSYGDDVPVQILGINTIKLLCDSLNSPKVFKSSEGLCRDWRGLAHLCGIRITSERTLCNPTEHVLAQWQKKEKPCIKQFLCFLERLDRYDVIDDAELMIEKDVQRYLHLKDSEEYQTVQEAAVIEHDKNVITTDDACRFEKGLGPQFYDAFVLYADEEWDAVQVLVNYLEQNNFKLCLKDRDIIAGLPVEEEAIYTLIEKRCHRLLILLSPKFVESEANKIYHYFAHRIQLRKKLHKVVPCLYKYFPSVDDVPPEFQLYTKLRYDDLYRRPDDFWNRLKNSIRSPNNVSSRSAQNGVILQELSTSESVDISPALPSLQYDVNNSSGIVAITSNSRKVLEHPNSDENILKVCDINEVKLCDSLRSTCDTNCKEDVNLSNLIKNIKFPLFKRMTEKFSSSKKKQSKRKLKSKCPL